MLDELGLVSDWLVAFVLAGSVIGTCLGMVYVVVFFWEVYA